MEKLESAARQVWQEFSPRDGEDLAFGDSNLIEVTIGAGIEGFEMDPDRPFAELVSELADRLQGIIMEDRQRMIPDCPLHPDAHPLQSEVVDSAAAWVCPSTRHLVRYMKVTDEASLVLAGQPVRVYSPESQAVSPLSGRLTHGHYLWQCDAPPAACRAPRGAADLG